MKTVKAFEEPGLLINNARDTIENEEKNKKVGFLVCYWVH